MGRIHALFLGFAMLVSSSAGAQPLLQDQSSLGKSCTSRSFVSGIVEIPFQVSGAVSVQISGLQYSDAIGWTFPKSEVLLLPSGDGQYKLYVDTRRLYNGWANLDLYAYDSNNYSSGFSVFLYVQNSAMLDTGALASLSAPASGGDTGSGSGTGTGTGSGDAIAPTISLGGLAQSRNSLTVITDASDNVGVTEVRCSIDGSLTASSKTDPFTVSFSLKKLARGSHSVQCKAFDAAGNSGMSGTLTFVK